MATKKNIEKTAAEIIKNADKRTDSKGNQKLNNASETLGMICREIGGINEKNAERLLPFADKGKALETMRAFLETTAHGKKEKAPMIPKAQLAQELAEAKAELAAMKAKK